MTQACIASWGLRQSTDGTLGQYRGPAWPDGLSGVRHLSLHVLRLLDTVSTFNLLYVYTVGREMDCSQTPCITTFSSAQHLLGDLRILPIARVEPVSIVLAPISNAADPAILGEVHAPSSIPGSALMVTALRSRVPQDTPVVFRLSSVLSEGPFKSDALTALSQVVEVWAVLKTRKTEKLAYSVAPCLCTSSVDIIVDVPQRLPLESEVLLQRIAVAGTFLSPKEPPLCVSIGYNHETVPEGPVMRAARAGNAVALQLALDEGHSTEERTDVSLASAL
jgi:hypothetical protein